MKLSYGFFMVSLIGGILLLIVGIYLMYINQNSSGITAQYDGSLRSGTVNGPSSIILGIIVLAISGWAYYSYNKEKKELDKME